MARFTAATYHANIQVAEFICDDGRHLLRCGGTLPWRINNGGDLKSPVDEQGNPAPRKTKNYIGFAGVSNMDRTKVSHFFMFPDYEAGREQLKLCLQRLHGAKTIPLMAKSYAPSSENDTQRYAEELLRETGLSARREIKDFDSVELDKLADAIEKLEGYHNEKGSRKEVWVPVSRITATDGARPLADEEIILRIDGKDTQLKTNQHGQVPPIVHAGGKKVEVLHKQAGGETKTVGTIEGDKGEHFSLKVWFQRVFAQAGSDEPPNDAQSRRVPLAYTVQPNDTLSKLAVRFKTTVEQIKHDNGLRKDVIFVGQRLSIHGPLSAATTPPAVKRAAPKADPATKGKAAPPTDKVAKPARSKAGTGKPIALVRADQRLAPWMAVAFREVTTFAGKDEREITKTRNYHRLVTDSDRAGGRVVPKKGKDGKLLLDKSGKPITKTVFDGAFDSIIGSERAWCASFVNYCLKESGYAPGRRHMSSFTFGENRDLFVSVKQPIYGAIRFSLRPGEGGHVCFVYGAIGEKLVILGGNQGDQLNFQLRKPDEKGSAFFVPIPYKDFAGCTDGAVLPTIDIERLRDEFGDAVKISDEQIKENEAEKGSES